jgi:hypothetical protein
MITKTTKIEIESHVKTCNCFKKLTHFSFMTYQLPISVKYFKTINNRIRDEAMIIKTLISNPIRTNSNPIIVGINVIRPERRMLLVIIAFLTILSLKYRFL